jgi:hypothetical protein
MGRSMSWLDDALKPRSLTEHIAWLRTWGHLMAKTIEWIEKLSVENLSLKNRLDAVVSEESVERVARAMWQEENIRVMGRPRLVPWSQAAVGEAEKWRGLAKVAIKAVCAEVKS